MRRNRFDNIIWFNPPGGLPEDLGNELESLRRRMALNPDVRLDIVSVDTGNVPQRLIDLCARSRGSWLFAPDIDSFGAVGQRLRGEGLTGSWVIAPEKGVLDLTPTSQKAGDAGANATVDPARPPRGQPLGMLADRLLLLSNLNQRVNQLNQPVTDLNWPRRPNPESARLGVFRASPLDATFKDEGRVLEAFSQYSSAFAPDAHLTPGPELDALAYSNLYNVNFFTPNAPATNQGGTVPETPSQFFIQAIGVRTSLMPSLATLRDDLSALGNRSGNIDEQTQFTTKILPSIGQLDNFRNDLNRLCDFLKALDVKDTAELRQALKLTIDVRRQLAELPRDAATPVPNSDEFIFRSKSLRQAIERAILVRLHALRQEQGTLPRRR